MLLGSFRQHVAVGGVVAGGISPRGGDGDHSIVIDSCHEDGGFSGGFFSRRRLARMAGSVWRSVGPFGIYRGVPRGAKSLRWVDVKVGGVGEFSGTGRSVAA